MIVYIFKTRTRQRKIYWQSFLYRLFTEIWVRCWNVLSALISRHPLSYWLYHRNQELLLHCFSPPETRKLAIPHLIYFRDRNFSTLLRIIWNLFSLGDIYHLLLTSFWKEWFTLLAAGRCRSRSVSSCCLQSLDRPQLLYDGGEGVRDDRHHDEDCEEKDQQGREDQFYICKYNKTLSSGLAKIMM